MACFAGGTGSGNSKIQMIMKRALLKQMRKEWRDNVWLIVELTVVCLAIWVISAILYANIQGLFKPRGFDPDNIYSLTNNSLSNYSSAYIEGLDDDAYYADFQTLLNNLRNNKNVEAVAVHWNGLPYNYNHSGNTINLAEELDTVGYYGNVRTVTPDYIKVLGIKSKTGATAEQLIEMLRKGNVLISDNNNLADEQGVDVYSLKGKKMIFSRDSANVVRVGDIIQNVRRTDYEIPWGGTIIRPFENEEKAWGQVAVRVKPGKGEAFEEDFRNDVSLRKLRNVYLSDLRSLDDIREGCQRGVEVDVRLYEVMIGFLLMTVFLGLLGTFWFRMQQRVSEIAIRKVAGANKGQVFRRILSEGMILLGIAVVIASAILWPIALTDSDIAQMGFKTDTVLILELITIALMAIGIILSLWWPARKAMAIEPAIAIKDE